MDYLKCSQSNTLSTYVLAALINKPKRLVYQRSGMHRGGDFESAGPGLEGTALERLQRLRRHETPRRDSRVRGHPQMAGRPVQCSSSRVGCRQKWAARARRMTSTRRPKHRSGSLPARARSEGLRAILLSHEAPRRRPGGFDRLHSGSAVGGMRPPFGRAVSGVARSGAYGFSGGRIFSRPCARRCEC